MYAESICTITFDFSDLERLTSRSFRFRRLISRTAILGKKFRSGALLRLSVQCRLPEQLFVDILIYDVV